MGASSRLPRSILRCVTVACLAVPLLATTCIPATHVRLERDSGLNAPAFTFRVGDEALTAVREFGVYACRPDGLRRPVWQIRPSEGGTVEAGALRVTYGQVPPGYTSDAPALPLHPRKCYEAAAVPGNGRTFGLPGAKDFYLERDGRVRELRGESAYELAMKHEQVWHRVAVQCRRGYRRARTAQDSAAVDARTLAIADTSLTCGWMLKAFPEDVNEAVSSERGTVAFIGLVGLMAALVAGSAALDRTLGIEQ